MKKFMLLPMFFFLLLTQDVWAEEDNRYLSIDLMQGAVLPVKGHAFGGSVAVHISGFDVGVSYKRLARSGEDGNVMGVEWGYKPRSFFRIFTAPSFVWGAGLRSFVGIGPTPPVDPKSNQTPVLPIVWEKQWSFQITAGVEFCKSLSFSNVSWLEEIALRAEYLPDQFDGRVGGKGGDLFLGGRLGLKFPF